MCIFARRLSEILDARDKRIGSLHTVVVGTRRNLPYGIPPLQIIRLKRAASGDCTISVTLSPEQLEAVRIKFDLDEEEMRQLKAALLAESQLRLLLGRIPADRAVRMATAIFHMLLDARTLDAFDVDLDEVRGGIDDDSLADLSEPLALLEQRFHRELEPVGQVYDEAVLWLDRAYVENEATRKRMYAEQASLLLTYVGTLVARLSLPVEAAPLVDAWNGYIEQMRLEVVELEQRQAE